ncbi:hypothetical protein ACTHOQ_06405 [Solibacillus silvestris]|uniref:hypothetical protein n=1 Tax=Solibacillus silvestris TaxID=76853 RepID=UPI003F7EDC05
MMNNYIKLVNFEVKRFWKIFATLVIVVALAQMIGAVLNSFSFNSRAKEIMIKNQISESEYVFEYGGYSLRNFLNSEYFVLSIMFAATVLIIYVFFIWYRDWLGKSSIIYRLLMLPTERRNVYFAKLTAILLFVLCLVGVQIILLEVVEQIIRSIIPGQLREDVGIFYTYSNELLTILYPETLLQFVLTYGLGMTIVAIVFTAILFERSYHLKGIFIAVLYSAVSIFIIAIPAILQSITHYFYNNELILMTVVSSILALGFAIYMANYLLKRKINV